jgi:hypothetical protein
MAENLRVPPSDPAGDQVEDRFKQFVQSYRYYGDDSGFTLQQRLDKSFLELTLALLIDYVKPHMQASYELYGAASSSDSEFSINVVCEFRTRR